jgi:ribosomal protein S18 acetylase RimI-like enzyme
VGIDAERGELVGYGTWAHVDATVDGETTRHIEIAWFGIADAYQATKDSDGASIAGRLYATVEAAARRHPESVPTMPLTLVCHRDNRRGLAFWARRGYRIVNEAVLEDDVYYRLAR